MKRGARAFGSAGVCAVLAISLSSPAKAMPVVPLESKGAADAGLATRVWYPYRYEYGYRPYAYQPYAALRREGWYPGAGLEKMRALQWSYEYGNPNYGSYGW